MLQLNYWGGGDWWMGPLSKILEGPGPPGLTPLHSMIGYWRNPVVRLSVCLWRCALWLSGLVHRTKSCTYQRVLSRHVLICSFRYFCCRMCCLARKTHSKKRVEENASVSFFHDHVSVQPTYCWPAVTFLRHAWVDLVTGSGCVHKRNATIRYSSVPAAHRPKLVTTGLIIWIRQ